VVEFLVLIESTWPNLGSRFDILHRLKNNRGLFKDFNDKKEMIFRLN